MTNATPLPTGPGRRATVKTLLDWVNAVTKKHDPIAAVRRYGFELDARLVMVMESGEEVKVRQRDLMTQHGLRNVLRGHDGTSLPGYSQYDCGEIVSRIIWASEASIQDDERETLTEDLSTFLDRALTDGGVLAGANNDSDGYQFIANFIYVNRANKFVVTLALDQAVTPHVLWVPRGRLWTHLREVRRKLHVPDLRADIEVIGWQWEDFQRRGTGPKPHARVWTVPVDWEGCTFDLAEAVRAAKPLDPGTFKPTVPAPPFTLHAK